MIRPKVIGRTKKIRDTQRGKVYAAERELFATHGGNTFETIPEVTAYYDRLICQKWFQREFTHPSLKKVLILDGRGSRAARYHGRRYTDSTTALISLPLWARFELVMLHELAHALTPRHTPPHGREFCAAYLRLVRNRLGKETEALLKRKFTHHGAKWKAKRKLSATTLEKLRLRGKELQIAASKNRL